jgi:uncharacterized membrane protein YgdD (TMEM256/DUF423 family)
MRRMTHLLLALAGLMGACGVVLTAAAAHGKPGSGLDSAGYLLLLHAAAIVAVSVALRSGLLMRPLGTLTLWGFALGASLFAADVAARAYAGHRLFPMAAPAGGVILIISWLVMVTAALLAPRP